MDFASLFVYATPVALAGIGEAVNEKSGSINIGIEGTMLTSAFAAMWVMVKGGDPWVALLVGLALGLAVALLQSLLTILLNCDQVVVGTGLNLIALGVTGTLYRANFGTSGQLLSIQKLPNFLGADLIAWSIPFLALLAWFIVARTQWGLSVRACGEAPQAAFAAGYSVRSRRIQASLIGGALAGLAGAYLTVGVTGSFAENVTAGRGFMAIAIVTFGRWNPIGALFGALLIGYAESLQFMFQTKGVGLPHQLLIALPYIISLITLIIAGKSRGAPAALGKPYRGAA